MITDKLSWEPRSKESDSNGTLLTVEVSKTYKLARSKQKMGGEQYARVSFNDDDPPILWKFFHQLVNCSVTCVRDSVSRVNTVQVAGFGLASVGGTKDDDSLSGLRHWGGWVD